MAVRESRVRRELRETPVTGRAKRGNANRIARRESWLMPKAPVNGASQILCDKTIARLMGDVSRDLTQMGKLRERMQRGTSAPKSNLHTSTVRVHGATPDRIGGDLMGGAGFQHRWIELGSGEAAGMGNARGASGEGGQT